jgi:hypothetical protein
MASSATVLSQDMRGIGTHDGVPVEWPADATAANVTGSVSNADALDPGKTCFITLMVSYDGGRTFVAEQRANWQGGNKARDGVTPILPSVGGDFSAQLAVPGNPRPTHATARVELPQVGSIGASIAFTP